MNYFEEGRLLNNGKYRVIDTLGSGGFGITYLVEENINKQRVCIKTINVRSLQQQYGNPKRHDNNSGFDKYFQKEKEKFVREAISLATLNHSHIVKIYRDYFEEKNIPCIIMEYIDGDNLQTLAKQKEGFTEAEAIKYILEVGNALSYIHQEGILHLDVKPSNIMLRRETNGAVLIDFGLARDFIETPNHTISGTEGFAPLEQYLRSAKRGAYTDIYALAATLYYLLTLETPLNAQYRSSGYDLIPPQNHNQSISDRTNYAIIKGMELEAENRPQSIEEWFELLGIELLETELKKEKPPQEKDTNEIEDPWKDSSIDNTKNKVCNKYPKLKEFLEKQEWEEAEQETGLQILKLMNKESWEYVNQDDLYHLKTEDSKTDLKTIDDYWVDCSDGKFGFSVQKDIWVEFGGKPGFYDYEVLEKFGEQVGWRRDGNWLSDEELVLDNNSYSDAPRGKFPSGFMAVWMMVNQ